MRILSSFLLFVLMLGTQAQARQKTEIRITGVFEKMQLPEFLKNWKPRRRFTFFMTVKNSTHSR